MNCMSKARGLLPWNPRNIWPVALLAAALVLPVTALADENRPEREVPTGDAVHQTERPEFEAPETPQFRASQFIERRNFESQQRQDEAIVRLRQMIDRTPAGDPARAEYLYNLSEIFWERSRYYEHTSIELNDECFLYDDRGDTDGARRCRFRVRDREEESARLREESMDLYVEIIRNYPTFEHLDTVYFHLGSNLMELNRDEEGLAIFRRLNSEFPQNRFTPQVFTYFGDYYFDESDYFQALESYRQVLQYPDSPSYTYARYKLGWTYYGLDNYERALEEFLKVVDRAKAAPPGSSDRAMLRQVRGDVVRAYAQFGSPDQAIPFFQSVFPERADWLQMSETLAVYYGNQAQFSTSTRMYRNLINVNRESVAVIDYQYEIVRNQTTINAYDAEAIQEIIRTMRLIELAEQGQFADSDTDEYRRIFARVEEASRNWANTYHREAQRTLNNQLFVMAHHLYAAYHQTFPETDHSYDMYFFHGELLYRLQEWDEAARAYERVLEIDPEGEYTRDAVLSTVLALFRIVDTSEERAEIQTIDIEDDGEGRQIPEPIELDEMQLRLMQACRNYVIHVPDGDQIVEVKYTMARTYYDFKHFREAAEVFESIAFNHPEHRLALVSANLHLDSLNQLQDYQAMAVVVERYATENPISDPEFQNDIYVLNRAIRYNLCVELDEEERWEDAAYCYVEYAQDFPDSELVDRALYNAALDFERLNEVGRAIQVRLHLLRVAPQSELAPETLFNVGANYHALAVYGEASRYYEAFVRNFPNHENAERALSNASTFRQGLGEYDRAIANNRRYIELFGGDNPTRAAEVYFQIAQIYDNGGRHREAREHYQNYIRQYGQVGSSDQLIAATTRIGKYQWEEGNRRDALRTFNSVLATYNALSEEVQEELTQGADAAAEAQFMIAQDLFERAAEVDINSRNEEELQTRLREKLDLAGQAREKYIEVILFRRPDWAIAALYQVGRGFHDIAELTRNSTVPDRLTWQQEEIYRGLLEDRAAEFEGIAVDLYERALTTSRDYNWFNEYSQRAEEELAFLRPRDYRRPSEMRAQPSFFRDGFMKSRFILDVEEEEFFEDIDTDEIEDEPGEIAETDGSSREEGPQS